MFYLSLAGLLAPFYIVEAFFKKVRTKELAIYLSFVFFVVVAGLREDTGYDWYVYKGLYNEIIDISGFFKALSFGSENGLEWGFTASLYLIAATGAPFWVVQLLIAALNFFAFLRFNTLMGGGIAGLFIYYCWLFLVLQMAVARMSVAVSLLTFALIAYGMKRWLSFFILAVLACFFHVYSVVLLFFIFISCFRFNRKLVSGVVLVLAIAYMGGVDLSGWIASGFSGLAPAFISEKINAYLSLGKLYSKGVGEFIYKFFILFVFFVVSSRVNQCDRFSNTLYSVSAFYVVALFLFWCYPIFHDRIKYFSFMPLLYLYLSVVKYEVFVFKFFLLAIVFVFSLASIVYQVRNELFYPYVPYYNVYDRWLGAENDGEERTLRYYREFDANWGLR